LRLLTSPGPPESRGEDVFFPTIKKECAILTILKKYAGEIKFLSPSSSKCVIDKKGKHHLLRGGEKEIRKEKEKKKSSGFDDIRPFKKKQNSGREKTTATTK